MSRSRRNLFWMFALGAALIVLVGWAGLWLADDREADCGAYGIKRAAAICRALSDNMQFEWLGHAIIAPGYKVTFETVRRPIVVCGTGVSNVRIMGETKLRRTSI